MKKYERTCTDPVIGDELQWNVKCVDYSQQNQT